MTGTWMDKGIRDEVDMAQFAKADPRDVRIAELEVVLRGALDAGKGLSSVCSAHERRAAAYEARIAELEAQNERMEEAMVGIAFEARHGGDLEIIAGIADGALVAFPEGDMTIAHEELGA